MSLQVTYVLDTNILLYPHDSRDTIKQAVARELLRRLEQQGAAAIPVQALAEFSSVALRKFRPTLNPTAVYDQVLRLVTVFPVLPLTEAVVLEALRGVQAHQMSYYDAQIWAAARLAHARVILSEDFNPGATLEGINFTNPFLPGVLDVL